MTGECPAGQYLAVVAMHIARHLYADILGAVAERPAIGQPIFGRGDETIVPGQICERGGLAVTFEIAD